MYMCVYVYVNVYVYVPCVYSNMCMGVCVDMYAWWRY